MDITPYEAARSRSRSRSRTRNSTANSRSTSATRRPSLGSRKSISGSSLNSLTLTQQHFDNGAEMTIPSVSVTLDNTLPLDFFKQELIALIRALRISKWHKKYLTVNNVVVTRISGALTNSIYKVELKDPAFTAPSLLLRVYGKNVDSIIDRDYELSILVKLSPKKIGPKLLGIFSNGRFEQFLEGFLTMTKSHVRSPVISQMIGRRMKDLHYKIELDDRDRASDFPQAWIQIQKWLNVFEKTFLPLYKPEEIADIVLLPWDQFKQLVFTYRDWLFSKYDSSRFSENYRFCHNDTQYGNLLLRETFDPDEVIQPADSSGVNTTNRRDNDLAVIDFEYSGANFPAYDIADHFAEWMSDYADEKQPHVIHEEAFPKQAEQLNLIKSYIEYDFRVPTSNLRTKNKPSINESDVSQMQEYEIKKLYNEVVLWRSTVQFFWAIWGLLQNGPPKKTDIGLLGFNSEEKGVHSTFKITTGMDALSMEDSAIVDDDEPIGSTDDDFDYLKYSQQKAALIAGDMISFGLLSINNIRPEHHNLIKFLDTRTFDI
ncbi:hypothetical protein FT663_04909 [Candidozyma haemuli var. vulneris]|uniref:Choline kinase N-terminal domain-containing protein n=1 Tax=Candidozyma haemuli TaxID=45357 RepID=A0A2V1ASE4_9ASCO|nr:hypothetical protein CXQ85_004209 [[Candida] haemuloni]KAF3986392.1 hypothetical protein FT663_04909 [[Candida] haemuloni var. vulneris]KAF3991533.1 hypothetical protein FT662_01652 [[Candida] haemuloni var. vulneris]PVH20705.1 hypothetical protein CXQ85_004209 [[Candida] haemuloni]